MWARALAAALVATLTLGCGSSSEPDTHDGPPPADGAPADLPPAGPDLQPPADGGGTSDGATPNPCPRLPGPADAPRYVVVAHPFVAGGGKKSPSFEVLLLSKDGKLSKTGETFTLDAAAVGGEIVFTPDGKVALAALEGGTVGVISLDAAGKATVIEKALKTTAYTSRVVMGPEGRRAYLLSSQWRRHGGGVYSVKINCDGTITEEGLVAASKLPYAMTLVGAPAPSRALVVAKDILGSKAGDDVHLIGLGASWSLLAGVDAFGDDEAIVSAAALTPDERFLLVADNAGFSATGGDRVAVVELAGNTLKATQVIKPIGDPAAIVASPHGNAALVLGAMSNTIALLSYDPAAAPPFKLAAAPQITGKPQLPTDAVMIRRGTLNGRVLITENQSIRQLQFETSGALKEIELFSLGSGMTAIPGAIGIQP